MRDHGFAGLCSSFLVLWLSTVRILLEFYFLYFLCFLFICERGDKLSTLNSALTCWEMSRILWISGCHLCYTARPSLQMFSLCVVGVVRNEVMSKYHKQCLLSYMEPEHGLYLAPSVLVNGHNDLQILL